MLPRILSLALALSAFSALPCSAADTPWETTLAQELPLLGHRNWIVVADSAYPWQTAPGVETIDTHSDQITVVKTVLAALDKTAHVTPTIFLDAEIPLVPEADAKGITAYRDDLAKTLAGRETQSLLHEAIIGKLDEAGKTFHVLILKTKLTIPYTSVFFQLGCAYWNADAEARLRKAMSEHATK